MLQNPAIQSVNIVVLGQFNPAIFQPAWFAAQELIRPQEADAAEIEIVTPEVSVFQIDWCQIHVVRGRFQIGTSQEPYFEPVRDLVSGVFSLLSHTPVRAMGINWNFEYPLASEKTWHSVGHQLAPKDVWNDLLDNPGTSSLVIQGKRSDERPGHINVKVEPSKRIEFGINIDINDHYGLSSDSSTSSSTDEINDILSGSWSDSMQRAYRIFRGVAELGDNA